MTSNPPFHMEDQTDEDFFDKLVDDDLSQHGFGDANSFSGQGMRAGSGVFFDPDGVKAFDDFNFADLDPVSAGGHDGNEIVDSDGHDGNEIVDSDGHDVSGDANASIVANSDDIGDADGLDVGVNGSDSVESTVAGSVGVKVKEVDWSAFNTDVREKAVDGFGSYSDFFSEFGDNCSHSSGKVDVALNRMKEDCQIVGSEADVPSISSGHLEDGESQSVNEVDQNSSQYWESMYPGWKYDFNTGQWYQVDGDNSNSNEQVCGSTYSAETLGNYGGELGVSYFQQNVQAVSEVVPDSSSSGNVVAASQGTNEWPSHMVFDPQYPEWYYDTIAQEWRLLETYTSSLHSKIQPTIQHSKQCYDPPVIYSHNVGNGSYNSQGELANYGVQAAGHQFWNDSRGGSNGSMEQSYNNTLNSYADNASGKDGRSSFNSKQQVDNMSYSALSAVRSSDRHNSSSFIRPEATSQISSRSFNPIHGFQSLEKENQGHAVASGMNGLQIFAPSGSAGQLHEMEQKEGVNFSNDYYHNSHTRSDFSHNLVQNNSQFSSVSTVGRSSAGRPPHALVTFGFGGKVIVMKNDAYSENSAFRSQDRNGHSIFIHNMMEYVTGNTVVSSDGGCRSDYFQVICQQSFPGPLVGGNVGTKELNKWIDERIASCDTYGMDSMQSKAPWLLLSLLKIACQNYGKLRSPFGTDSTARDNTAPESAVANLFTSSKRHSGTYGVSSCCLQNFPSEGHIQASATEVQNLLVSGRTKEALHCAQEGQLWGPALVLAAQLGDQYYAETVKQMALQQIMAGSPLRTLCLLIAGHPAEVFSTNTTTSASFPVTDICGKFISNSMLDDWQENLAIITANKTKDDELVIIHLGDCLWKERSEVIAAHMCYLIAEASCESYSDGARMCLIGADHWKFPRTYSSPEAIQRTELYEYSKVLGNSQFNLLPFQPYKLVYAYMLAEVGRVSDALKYCQAVTKSLKTSRGPEVDSLKHLVLSFEERLKTHQQGGFTANLAPAKLVGKLLNLFDSTAHRVVGGLPPPVPSTSQSSAQNSGHFNQMGSRVSASQSTMAMSSLIPSASMEPINQWSTDNNRKSMHNRSASEPDFGRTPRQKDGDASRSHGKAPGTVSRFGRFGFGSQIFQKTMGLVLKRPDRQAKLGESNKFYYDEKLKRWMEEGTELPSEEMALPPPPTAPSFQNGLSSAAKEVSPTKRSSESKSPNPAELSSGIPPIHPGVSQFSTRGRVGVRSRYVDTFNQGGVNSSSVSSSNLFHSPSAASIKPTAVANPKFFVPTPLSATHYHTMQPNQEFQQELDAASTTASGGGFKDQSAAGMQRTPSMDNMTNPSAPCNGSLPSHSRRTASWGGSYTGLISPPKFTQTKPLGEGLGIPPSSFMTPPTSGDDMHEVEL